MNYSSKIQHIFLFTLINPEFLWIVLKKLGDLVRDGSWKTMFSEFRLFT